MNLIKVSGSANYLREDVTSQEVVRVTSSYNRRNRTMTIGNNLDVYADSCNFEKATHVVTEVTYGFNSYFSFEKTVTNSSTKQEIEG